MYEVPAPRAGRIEARLKEIVREVLDEKGAWLVKVEVMPDHVHLLVEVDPRLGVHRLVRAIKGRSSRLLREDLPALKSRLPTLWTNSYFVATVGRTAGGREEVHREPKGRLREGVSHAGRSQVPPRPHI